MQTRVLLSLIAATFLTLSCTQETQNQFGRAVQNWTGTNGVLEVYSGGNLIMRFMQIDKLTTAKGTQDDRSRPYRFGYGIIDRDLDGKANDGDKKVYFEFSDYSTSYIFYEAP